MQVQFTSLLLDWYKINARRLPWRETPDPYRVWISEIMLQQTRVETVIPYFERWMATFPILRTLAEAGLQEVLAVWEGLGYYSRARNLHRAARIIESTYAGQIPSDPGLLRKVPGIGPYTAAAIASIAFGRDEPALDGNVRRVLARVFDVSLPPRSPEGERLLLKLAKEYLPVGRAGEYNQALMDLGALVCTPRSPACPRCPLEPICAARALGIQEERPVTSPRRETPHFIVTAAVIIRDGLVLIARRPESGLLGGLWEFPGGKVQDGEALTACLKREIMEELGVEVKVSDRLGVYKHAYTHFRVTLHAFFCELMAGEPRPLQASAVDWATLERLPHFPMGKIDRQIAKDLLQAKLLT
jgi:A/G-specific adenine glycosylase